VMRMADTPGRPLATTQFGSVLPWRPLPASGADSGSRTSTAASPHARAVRMPSADLGATASTSGRSSLHPIVTTISPRLCPRSATAPASRSLRCTRRRPRHPRGARVARRPCRGCRRRRRRAHAGPAECLRGAGGSATRGRRTAARRLARGRAGPTVA
jgi:hypothetical protein